MRQPVSEVIEGVTYTIAPMDPAEGLPIFVRLTKALGSAFGEAIKGRTDLGSMLDQDVDLGAAVKELAGRLNEDEVLLTVKALLDPRYVSFRGPGKDEGGTVTLDHFAGDYGRLFKVLTKVLEVNYGRFLSGFKDAFAKLLRGLPTEKTPSKASTRGK